MRNYVVKKKHFNECDLIVSSLGLLFEEDYIYVDRYDDEEFEDLIAVDENILRYVIISSILNIEFKNTYDFLIHCLLMYNSSCKGFEKIIEGEIIDDYKNESLRVQGLANLGMNELYELFLKKRKVFRARLWIKNKISNIHSKLGMIFRV